MYIYPYPFFSTFTWPYLSSVSTIYNLPQPIESTTTKERFV